MGIRDLVPLWSSVVEQQRAGGAQLGQLSRNATRGIISPWQSGSLEAVAWSDIFGTAFAPVTLGEALRVPAIKRGRAVLHAVIASRPLVALDRTGKLAQQPTWLYRSDTGIPPQTRNAAMLDDLLFFGASLLLVQRGSIGQITDAVVCPQDRWKIEDELLLVDEQSVGAEQVVYIPGPSSGLLAEAADEIRGSRAMTDAWVTRANTPLPGIVFAETTESTFVDDDDRQQFVNEAAASRRSKSSGVMLKPQGVEHEFAPSSDDAALFENGRNALRIDIANHLNMPAALLDGSANAASLTYDTREGQRNDFQDFTVPYWAGPIEAALSQDNVVPRGTRVRFDFADLLTTTNAPTGADMED